MSAVVRANIVCILFAGIYNGIGRRGIQPFVGFNGHGALLRVKGKSGDLTSPPKKDVAAFVSLGKGLAIAGIQFIVGNLVAAFVPGLHPCAWTIIIIAAAVKIFGLSPKELEDASSEWGDMIGAFLIAALLVGVSIT
ncbi:Na+/citrate or Na+/malate symporter [Arthrobacter sp. UYCu712]